MPPTHKFLWQEVSKALEQCEAHCVELEEALDEANALIYRYENGVEEKEEE